VQTKRSERFGANEAQRIGLVSEVVAAEELDEGLEKLLSTLLQNGPAAVRASKALVVDFAGREISPEIIEDSCGRIAHIRVSEEGQEGLSAFLNKRKPGWLGD
jgi:methylglutaconyl-CoA hydratase